VLEAAGGDFAAALSLRLVEPNPEAERRQRDRLRPSARIGWHASLDEVPPLNAGVVFANEVLDNLPVHLVETRDGHLVELLVDEEDGVLGFTAAEPSGADLSRYLDSLDAELVEGHRMEVGLEAQRLVATAARVLTSGALLLVDYGLEIDALMARPTGTLVSYSRSGAADDVLTAPGEMDVTAHVNWTAIRRACKTAELTPVGPLPQSELLSRLGLGTLDDRLKEDHAAAVGAGAGADAVRALSRRHSLRVLTDDGGLGRLGVLAGIASIPMPPFLEGRSTPA
jgi:SAM-dependent MidA family methyltransferase